jgi:hypothetical protein
MEPISRPSIWREAPVLLRGEAGPINDWIERGSEARIGWCVVVIVIGAGAFGGAMGSWRAPLQALYTAVKFPLVVLLTTLGNGLLNGILAPLFGLNFRFRQSLLAVLMSFTIAAVILGAFSPIVLFLVWNTPPLLPDAPTAATGAHNFLLLIEVGAIAFAGVAANLRLRQLLERLSGQRRVARQILFSWLASNLLLGGQLSWILRPFIGQASLPVEFLRDNALQGNFFESIFHVIKPFFS